LVVAALLVWAAPAQADAIRLKDGTVIRGRVVEYEDGEFVIRLDASGGERITVSAYAVQRIEFGDEETETPERQPGVTLYVDEGFRGRSEVLHESDPDLRDNTIGNDSVTAIKVPHGTVVTLYSDVNYGGRSAELQEDESNLGRTALGNDTLSSIRIERPEPRPGVTLYVDESFRGRSEVLHEGDPDLRDNTIGNDSVTAIKVPRGYRVTLYADINYRGRSVELSKDESNLGRTTLGNDTLSSIRIEWVGMGWGR
jgi:hypothetical protein